MVDNFVGNDARSKNFTYTRKKCYSFTFILFDITL